MIRDWWAWSADKHGDMVFDKVSDEQAFATDSGDKLKTRQEMKNDRINIPIWWKCWQRLTNKRQHGPMQLEGKKPQESYRNESHSLDIYNLRGSWCGIGWIYNGVLRAMVCTRQKKDKEPRRRMDWETNVGFLSGCDETVQRNVWYVHSA